jgi:exodeoxyribonuclease V alpha subunit
LEPRRNDHDKDVYDGDLGIVSGIDMEEGELSIDFDGRESVTALASWMSWVLA